jgi:hypothetical protein
LNILQLYSRHSSHCSWLTSQSPYALLNFMSDQLFVLSLLLKSLNLAALLEYCAAHHLRPNWNPKSFTRPFAASTASRAGAGAGTVLLVSRLLVIVAASRVKLTSSRGIPLEAACTSGQVCRRGCCQYASGVEPGY